MSVSWGFHPIIQIITSVGCIGLVLLTWNIYNKTHYQPLKRFIISFIIIAVILIVRTMLPTLETFLPPAHEMYETIIESFQFLAAVFFAWGYREIYGQSKKAPQEV
ncbi:MAG: hypothetical protein ACFFE8_11855 [Candidatus Heimdallarchaeota archaeon]